MSNPIISTQEGIIIKSELIDDDKIYPCIHEGRLFLFFKNRFGLLNCYEVRDQEIADKIRSDPNSDSIKKLLSSIIESNDY